MRCAIKTCKHNINVTDANVNINDRLSHQSLLPYLYYYTYQYRNNPWTPYCVVSFNMGWRILVF